MSILKIPDRGRFSGAHTSSWDHSDLQARVPLLEDPMVCMSVIVKEQRSRGILGTTGHIQSYVAQINEVDSLAVLAAIYEIPSRLASEAYETSHLPKPHFQCYR